MTTGGHRNRPRPRPGGPAAAVAVAVVALGVVLLVGVPGLNLHAATTGRQVPAGQPVRLGPGPVLLVGLVEPGVAVEQPVTCTIGRPAAAAQTIRLPTRRQPEQTIHAGRRVNAAAGGGWLVCDRRVLVADGPLVHAYPLALPVLPPAGGVLLLFGLGYARHLRRSAPAAGPGGRVSRRGGDTAWSDLARYTGGALLAVAEAACGAAALLLAVVGLVGLSQAAPGGLLILAAAGVPAACWWWIRRTITARPAPPADPAGPDAAGCRQHRTGVDRDRS